MTSPGPSQQAPPPFHSTASASAPRQKPKPPPGIAAGAEDAKYKAKYRELKKKVREIEIDNDRVYTKTLQAKRNIQRMRIERAILYERLSVPPPSPRAPEHQTVPAHGHPSQHYPPAPHTASRPHYLPPREALEPAVTPVDINDPAAVEYYRSLGIPIRRATGPDGHLMHVAEVVSPVSAPVLAPLPPRSSRHSSSHRERRQHAQQQPPPMHHMEPANTQHRPEHHRNASGSYAHSPSAVHAHSHSRSHSRSNNHASAHMSGYSHDAAPSPYHDPRGDYMPSERRSHRADEYAPPPVHMQVPISRGHTPPYDARYEPRSPASPPRSSRIDTYPRMGPGADVNNLRPSEHEHRDRESEREWSARERELRYRDGEGSRTMAASATHAPTPPYASRAHSMIEERDAYPARSYEPRGYNPDAPMNGGAHGSRSLTPRSRSGSLAAHPDDAVRNRYYEREYDQRSRAGRGGEPYPDARPRQTRSDVESDVEMDDAPHHGREES